MIVSTATTCCLAIAALNQYSPTFREQIGFVKNPASWRSSSNPDKQLHYRRWELARLQDWLRKAEKQLPENNPLIPTGKKFIREQELVIKQLEDDPFSNFAPIPLLNGDADSLSPTLFQGPDQPHRKYDKEVDLLIQLEKKSPNQWELTKELGKIILQHSGIEREVNSKFTRNWDLYMQRVREVLEQNIKELQKIEQKK